MKVSIVGVGRVGAALGLVLVSRDLVDELVLVGRSVERTRGEAIDLLHASAFGRQIKVTAGVAADTAGSDVVVFCIGARTATLDRAAAGVANWETLRQAVPELVSLSPNAVLIVTTNPVDALTTLVGRLAGVPDSRVIGTGTLLDTMRLRVAISERCRVHPSDIRAYVLGEHGDSQFAAWSSASAGGGRLSIAADVLRQIERDVRDVGHQLMTAKGYTNHGIALATAELIEAIVRDSRQVMPVSVRVNGFLGTDDVCLSLPVVIGRRGVCDRIALDLSADEQAAWHRSADVVRTTVGRIETAASLA